MREIKFRGWDKETKQMFLVLDINLRDSCSSGCITLLNWWTGTCELDGFFDEGGNIVLMQYTGLKDTNGIEIYENDVREDILGHRFVVEYDNDLATYIGKYSDGRFNYLADLSESYLRGNIYEDPNLLEEEKACVTATEQE